MSDLEDMRILAEYLEDNQTLVCVQVAMLTIMIAHVVETFTEEVERIWTSKQSLVTTMFYMVRYLPPLWTGFTIWCHTAYGGKISEEGCRSFWLAHFILTMMVIILSENLVLIRIWVLYAFNRQVVAFFVVVGSVGAAVEIWATKETVDKLFPLPKSPVIASIPGCRLTHVRRPDIPAMATLAFFMVASFLVFLFMLNRCLARDSLDRPFLGSWCDLLGIRTAFPVVHVLMRDGCANFLILSCFDLCMLIIVTHEGSFVPYVCVLAQTVYSIPATRLVLNLRSSAKREDQCRGVIAAEIVLSEVSNVQFAQRSSFDAEESYVMS